MRSYWPHSVTALMLGSSMLPFVLALGSARPVGEWIAFRYDASRVLFYLGEMEDPATLTEGEVKRQQVRQPLARWGAGGYLMPLAPLRWATFEPRSNTSFPEFHLGDHVSVLLNADATVEASVNGFLEQWGGAHPVVQIGVLARVIPEQLSAFRAAKSNYFLAYSSPAPPAPADNAPAPDIIGPRRILNRFGGAGELVLVNGDDGWSIRLWRRIDGRLVPTAVTYAYGD